jgi:hypothetical protein
VAGVSVNVWNAKRCFLERGHRGGEVIYCDYVISLSKSKSYSRRSAGVLLLVGVLAGVTVGGGVGVIAASSSKSVTVCANKKTNVLRYAKNGKCAKTETKVVLNQKGVAGAKGDTGAAGTNGTNGATGAKGDTGAAGTNGTNGMNGADGIPGPAGPSWTVTRRETSSFVFAPGGGSVSTPVRASCLSDEIVLSGGFALDANTGFVSSAIVMESRPFTDGTTQGWQIAVSNNTPFGVGTNGTVFAVCADTNAVG